MIMKKQIYVILTMALFAGTTEFSIAEDNIRLSDDYFEINPANNSAAEEGVLSIEPSKNWNLKREMENSLIEESSFNENSADGIITQEGMASAPGKNDGLMQTASQNTVKENNDGPNSASLPKKLKVRQKAKSIPQADPVETSLGDWVFDFPK